MQKWAKQLYQSKHWKNHVRPYIFARDKGLCVRCGDPGKIVHHIKHLTPLTVSDPLVAYGEQNLELVCEKCHASIHMGEPATEDGFIFDESGNLLPDFKSRTKK
jgi:5-methylcytosine-specific restriction endonuclease McrA